MPSYTLASRIDFLVLLVQTFFPGAVAVCQVVYRENPCRRNARGYREVSSETCEVEIAPPLENRIGTSWQTYERRRSLRLESHQH